MRGDLRIRPIMFRVRVRVRDWVRVRIQVRYDLRVGAPVI